MTTNKRIPLILIITALFLMPSLPIKAQEPDLPEKYKKWFEEEAIYIITAKEKEVFKQLETNKERDSFIQEFWKQRDPTAGTPTNEFKDEHYRRIEYANKTFGKHSPAPGWKSDQGRIYITLGEPLQIERILHSTAAHPTEIWYYRGNVKFGQAPIFRLLFFKRSGVGEFELYSPTADGPRSLTHKSDMRQPTLVIEGPKASDAWRDKVIDPRDMAAYEVLREFSIELAEAAWSSFPGRDGPDFSMQSDVLIGEVKTYPQKKINDEYALEFLEHKAVVEVDYSVKYITNRALLKILQDHSGLFFINYCVEPETLSVDNYEDKFYTNLRTTIRVASMQGKTIFQHSRDFPVELKKDDLVRVLNKPFNLLDSFPMIPGVYKLYFLLENMVTKEFATFEKYISIPKPDSFQIGPLVLSNKIIQESPYGDLSVAFKIGALQIYPSIENKFHNKDTLYIFFQIHGLSPELHESGIVDYTFWKEDKKVHSFSREISQYSDGKDFLQEFILDKFSNGEYKLTASLMDKERHGMLSKEENFTVTGDQLPDKWIANPTNPPVKEPIYAYITGNQYLNAGEIEKAKDFFQQAHQGNPTSLDFSLNYARTLLLAEEIQQAKDILQPFAEANVNHFLLFYYLGKASHGLGEYEEAIAFYQKALTQRGNVTEILNSIGGCYHDLGNKEQALRAWQRSLELNPNQSQIRELVESLKKD